MATPPPVAAPPSKQPSRQPSAPPSNALASFLDEELAASAAKAQAAAARREEASGDAFGDAAAEGEADGPRMVKCPHCDFKINAEELYCPACGLSTRKTRHDLTTDRTKEESKDWMFVLLGIGLALVTSPLFFLLIKMVVGAGLAMFVCAIEIYFVVAIGSFSLACRIFKQDPPDVNDIFRIIGWSALPANVLSNWLGHTGIASMMIGTLIAIIISSLLCMLQVQMPVFSAILVSITYNIFSAVLTIIGVLLLVAMFVTMGDDGIQSPMDAPTPPAGFQVPGGGDEKDDEEMDDEKQGSLGRPMDSGLVATWADACAA